MAEPRGRIVVIESPNPLDVLQGRSEAQTLAAACKLIGYETATYMVRSLRELRETIQYVATIAQDHDDSSATTIPLVVHVSCHGDDDGLQFGQNELSWKQLAGVVKPLCTMGFYDPGFVLSISACGAGKQKLTSTLTEDIKLDDGIRPPRYVFVTADDEVSWDDATVSWVSLYHQLGGHNIDHRLKIRDALPAITTLTGVTLKYFRWVKTDSCYKFFSSDV
tara:strand:+ start:10052 stop:10714 length:663 start_codon:yes stop_codon:yes gene_type:complete